MYKIYYMVSSIHNIQYIILVITYIYVQYINTAQTNEKYQVKN